MKLKKSDKYLLTSIFIVSSLWLVFTLIQKTSPPSIPAFPAEMLKPLDAQLDSGVLKIIKKHRGL